MWKARIQTFSVVVFKPIIQNTKMLLRNLITHTSIIFMMLKRATKVRHCQTPLNLLQFIWQMTILEIDKLIIITWNIIMNFLVYSWHIPLTLYIIYIYNVYIYVLFGSKSQKKPSKHWSSYIYSRLFILCDLLNLNRIQLN